MLLCDTGSRLHGVIMESADNKFHIRTVLHTDIDQLLELEKEWPPNARASEEELVFRINRFQQGFFIAEDETGIIASIISHPYNYQPDNLSNFKNWEMVVKQCYQSNEDLSALNALYIVSGTSKPTRHGGDVFDGGVMHVVELGKKLGKQYAVAGCILPGYARYIENHGPISAVDYVFTQKHNRYLDPLVDRYRKLGFNVPVPQHVISDYFPHEASLNYSALVVRELNGS